MSPSLSRQWFLWNRGLWSLFLVHLCQNYITQKSLNVRRDVLPQSWLKEKSKCSLRPAQMSSGRLASRYYVQMGETASLITAKNPLVGRPLSTYRKFYENLTFLTPWYAHVRVRIRGLEMLIFSENFPYLLNGWPLNTFEMSVVLVSFSWISTPSSVPCGSLISIIFFSFPWPYITRNVLTMLF